MKSTRSRAAKNVTHLLKKTDMLKKSESVKKNWPDIQVREVRYIRWRHQRYIIPIVDRTTCDRVPKQMTSLKIHNPHWWSDHMWSGSYKWRHWNKSKRRNKLECFHEKVSYFLVVFTKDKCHRKFPFRF